MAKQAEQSIANKWLDEMRKSDGHHTRKQLREQQDKEASRRLRSPHVFARKIPGATKSGNRLWIQMETIIGDTEDYQANMDTLGKEDIPSFIVEKGHSS